MTHTFSVLLEEVFPGIQEVAAFPFIPSFVLGYRDRTSRPDYQASKNWVHPGFSVVRQVYDAPDAFISVLEIVSKTPLSIPLQTEKDDLHWVYCLLGKTEVAEAGTKRAPLCLREKEYVLAYTCKKRYVLSVGEGSTLIFSFSVKAHWLLRPELSYNGPLLELLQFLGRRSFDCVSSRVLPMHPLVTAQYLLLLSLRVVKDIRLDVKIYGPVTELVVLSQDDLVEKKKKEKGSAVLAAAVRIYVTDMVKEGIFPSVEEIAKDCGISTQYLNRIYRKHAGTTLQHDMHLLRMEEALTRLKTGYSPHEVSDWLEYEHYSTFSRQFSKYHHFPPESV